MTLEQHKAHINTQLIEELFAEVKAHDKAFTPQTVTEKWWLPNLKHALIPCGEKRTTMSTRIRGTGLTFVPTDWPVNFSFRNNILEMGFNRIHIDCFERAVEDVRFMSSRFPHYRKKYGDEMKNAELEIKKDKMIQEIRKLTKEAKKNATI